MGAEEYVHVVPVVVELQKGDVVARCDVLTYFPDAGSNPVIDHLPAVLDHQDKVVC